MPSCDVLITESTYGNRTHEDEAVIDDDQDGEVGFVAGGEPVLVRDSDAVGALIHLLNMLIAIMGETFGQNNEIKKKTQIRNHLRFVLDNSWMEPIDDKEKITYLITSYLSKEDDHESEVIKDIHDTILNM